MKKPFKETKVGSFLKEKAPHILEKVGDILPDKGVLGIVKGLIQSDDKMTPEDKEMALKHLEADMQEMEEVTKRWQADMMSDSWLSKNARPLVLLSLVLMLFVFITLDSMAIEFDIKNDWIALYEMILCVTIGGYFGSRAVEKYHGRKFK